MSHIFDLGLLNHRSKKRIQALGEVFTPESYVEEMLDIFSKNRKKIWSDENVVFFEPCCGHGNIVLPVYRRRLDAIYMKAIAQGHNKPKEACFYAVANALNTLWAIDIDQKNIENTRSRVLNETLEFLKGKLNFNCYRDLIDTDKDFFSHVISAIKWHVDENETLSALSEDKNARSNAELTKAGSKWFLKNGHNELDFDLTWVNFYESVENSNTVPLEYSRSAKFIEAVVSERCKGFDDYNFAKVVLLPMLLNDFQQVGA